MATLRSTEISHRYSPDIHIYSGGAQKASDPPRVFGTGALRDTAEGKYDFEGFLSPLVLCRYAQYLHKHRKMADGSLRDSDNWQKGLPMGECLKSAWRHFVQIWVLHRSCDDIGEGVEEALCATIFNLSTYLHELLRRRDYQPKTGE